MVDFRIGADDCGSNESNVSTRTSIVTAGASSPSKPSSPGESRRSGKGFLQHIISSETACKYSLGQRSICKSNWMSILMHASCNLFASPLSPQFLSCHRRI
ncbi:hypothetical protein PRUPE_5G028500 [Prunus persica]|uniref:Uncharacterized protein n=1 Tax=Prunus persica TaxID=3760 RepID=A0A251P2S9_PRUPE|nr:hypothetical protein PRUPE_5G028500 [Prunus persica]